MEGQICYFGAEFRVCVDRLDVHGTEGFVHSGLLRYPLPFSDFARLTLCLDEVMDVRNYPQAFQAIRTFRPAEQPKPAPAYAAQLPEEGMSAEAVSAAFGRKTTFTIRVISRLSATWQGQLELPDECIHFPSVLVLLRLLDQRLMPEL